MKGSWCWWPTKKGWNLQNVHVSVYICPVVQHIWLVVSYVSLILPGKKKSNKTLKKLYFPNPSAMEKCDTKSVIKENKASLNSVFLLNLTA